MYIYTIIYIYTCIILIQLYLISLYIIEINIYTSHMCFPIPTQHETCGVLPWVRLLYQLSARTATFEPKPSPINTGSFVEHGTIRKCRSSPCLSVPGNKNWPSHDAIKKWSSTIQEVPRDLQAARTYGCLETTLDAFMILKRPRCRSVSKFPKLCMVV